MKKNILFIILCLIFCAGCSAKYNVTINEDGSVEESLVAQEDDEFFEQYTNSSIGLVVSNILSPYLDSLNSKGYLTETNINNSNGGVTITNKYSSFEEYVSKSIIYNQFTDKINYSKDGKIATISLDGKFSHSEQNQEYFPVDNGLVSITIPYKIVEHNADKVEDNVYTWNFGTKDDQERTIKVVYNESKLVNKQFNYGMIIFFGVTIILLIVLFIMYNKFNSSRKSANEI